MTFQFLLSRFITWWSIKWSVLGGSWLSLHISFPHRQGLLACYCSWNRASDLGYFSDIPWYLWNYFSNKLFSKRLVLWKFWRTPSCLIVASSAWVPPQRPCWLLWTRLVLSPISRCASDVGGYDLFNIYLFLNYFLFFSSVPATVTW